MSAQPLTAEEVMNLSAEELLRLIDHPQKEVAEEVQSLLKEELRNIHDKWLCLGLLEYFFMTHSTQILELLMVAGEPHDKYLLDKIADGLRGQNKFQYTTLLLYAARCQTPPVWLDKIPSSPVIKELLSALMNTKENIYVLVTGLLTLVLLLPVMPLQLSKHMPRMLDAFWAIVHWKPLKEDEEAFKPYLQIVVYTYFHRLYALYPCNLIAFLRNNVLGQPSKALFLNTLRPMLERVRLHPLLISESRESELDRTRWMNLETHQIIHECSKMCLDELQETCDAAISHCIQVNRECVLDCMPEPTSTILCSSDNSFWSPGVVQSPGSVIASVPHTPVYPIRATLQKAGSFGDSPPETAIEATPETTPFTSPIKLDMVRSQVSTAYLGSAKQNIAANFDSLPDQTAFEHSSPSQIKTVSSLNSREQFGGDGMALKSRLYQVHIDRENQRRDDLTAKPTSPADSLGNTPVCTKLEDSNSDLSRRRKQSVYDGKLFHDSSLSDNLSDLDFSNDHDSLFPVKHNFIDQSIPEGNEDYEVSTNSDTTVEDREEGLGMLSHRSLSDLVQSVKKMRLRFLSQCGPPPNLPRFDPLAPMDLSPSGSKSLRPLSRSLSCPNIAEKENKETSYKAGKVPKREYLLPKPLIRTEDAYTQTEEHPIVNPFEQLLEALMPSPKMDNPKVQYHNLSRGLDTVSPHMALENYLQHCFSVSGDHVNHEYCGALHSDQGNDVCLLQMVMLLERHKREIHARRNRALLGKVRMLHLFQERDVGLQKELNSLRQETAFLHSTVADLQHKYSHMEEQLKSKHLDQEVKVFKDKDDKCRLQIELLKETCSSLRLEKQNIQTQLEAALSELQAKDRELCVQSKMAHDVKVLRSQVHSLQKRLLLMGELQVEMKQQLLKSRYAPCVLSKNALNAERIAAGQHIQQLEENLRKQTNYLQATTLRISQLQKNLAEQSDIIAKYQEVMKTHNEMWSEKCKVLQDRISAMGAANLTLETHVMELQRQIFYLNQKSQRSGAGLEGVSEETSTDSRVDGTFPIMYSRENAPEPSAGSYLDRMESAAVSFRRPSSPACDKNG